MKNSERKTIDSDFRNPPARRATRRGERGFTLAHLLGIIVLLAIPATILFPIIATPSHGEVSRDDDADAVPAPEQREFIRTVADARPKKDGLHAELAVFRTWVRDTQGADVSFSAKDDGRTLTACFATPSTRRVAANRAKRLHWYYAYLRRAYLPGAKSAVVVVDSQGRMLAVCRGNGGAGAKSYFAATSWLRWASAGLPFTRAMHRTMASDLRRFALATHRL